MQCPYIQAAKIVVAMAHGDRLEAKELADSFYEWIKENPYPEGLCEETWKLIRRAHAEG